MTYQQLLHKLEGFGIVEIGRTSMDGEAIAYLGIKEEAVFPFPFTFYPVYVQESNDFTLHSEEVKAILRRFNIKKEEFFD